MGHGFAIWWRVLRAGWLSREVRRQGRGTCCGRLQMQISQSPKLSGPTISQHLLVLKNAGIIVDEKRGKRVFFRLLMPCVAEIALCLREGEST